MSWCTRSGTRSSACVDELGVGQHVEEVAAARPQHVDLAARRRPRPSPRRRGPGRARPGTRTLRELGRALRRRSATPPGNAVAYAPISDAALHAGVTADRHEPGARPADVAAGEREVHDRGDVVDAVLVLRDPHRPDQHRGSRRRVDARRSAPCRRATRPTAPRGRRTTRARARRAARRSPSVCSRTNSRSIAALGEHHLQHAVDERDVATDVHREEVVGHLGAEHRALDVARHPVALEPGLAQRVDHHDLRAALAGEVEVLHEDRLRVGDVGAEQHDQIGVDHVGVGAGRRGDPDRALQRGRRRRVAHARRVVDVVGAEEPRRPSARRSTPRW